MAYDAFPWEMSQYCLEEYFEGLDGDLLFQELNTGTPSSGTSADLLLDTFSLCSARVIDELGRSHKLVYGEGEPPKGVPEFDMVTVRDILSADNLKAHLSAFFRWTNVVIPTVHRPTFDMDLADPALIVSMYLCGALYLHPRPTAERQTFYDLAEEYVFRRLEEQVSYQRNLPTPCWENKELVALMQAALYIYTHLWLMSNPTRRRRGREMRLGSLLTAIRALKFNKLKHIVQDDVDPQWTDFVALESCIRVTNFTFYLDWQQSGTFHLPPLSSIYELSCELPCQRDLWYAKTASEFDELVASNGKAYITRGLSARFCVEGLLSDDWTRTYLPRLRAVNVQDLSQIVTALHAVALSAALSCTFSFIAAKLHRATTRWTELWSEAATQIDKVALKRSGMVGQAPIICFVLRWLVERMSKDGGAGISYFESVGHESIEALHDLFSAFVIGGGPTETKKGK
ncbi:hypothetical protein jhhlp_008365 [Lomentospora prolificans]|uniref:Xylanolytic transcriptional activator regulatory domain-containing protein n=1 Tax=Lomentospora prolificans TaxID=41688 RepID=A0A2N3MXT9_9PEZI|nr:hypothetical protein jhhlp_008365 [Lomentospora prolificans]